MILDCRAQNLSRKSTATARKKGGGGGGDRTHGSRKKTQLTNAERKDVLI